MHIRLIATILVMNVATSITSIVLNDYSYLYGSLLGGIGAIIYFYSLVLSANLLVRDRRKKLLKRKLFAYGFSNYFVKISILGLIVFIAIKINYNFNSGNNSLWKISLHPINWWTCFGTLLFPALNAFLINIPWHSSKKIT